MSHPVAGVVTRRAAPVLHDPSRTPVDTTGQRATALVVAVAEDLLDLSRAIDADLGHLALSPDFFVYSCPWCILDLVDGDQLARQIMERHLDRHIANGDHLPSHGHHNEHGLRVVA